MSAGTMMKVGSHVSIEGGVSRAISNASLLGCTAFSMWLKNSRGWTAKPYEADEIERFRTGCEQHNYNPRTDILPHASYLINLGNPDPEKMERSRAAFLDELQRCEQLGIGLYNIHPGSSLGGNKSLSIDSIAGAINWAHEKTSYVTVVLENMAGDPGRIVGSELTDLASVISKVNDKERIGVCIDSCHTLAAGWDLTQEPGFSNFWEEFESTVGMKYLSAIHLNDSCWPLGSHRDQHASVGTGFCGLEMFRLIMNRKDLVSVPKILETPTHEADLAVLKSLIGESEADSGEARLRLLETGRSMREANQKKIDAKREKEANKGTRKRKISTLDDFKVVIDKKPRAKNTKDS